MASKTPTAFTARETELLTIAFQCFKAKPDIDYDLMASKANLKGAKSARDSFTPLYNKIVARSKTSGVLAASNGNGNGEDKNNGSEASSPSKATPKKRKSGKEAGDEGSPTKQKKVTPGKKGRGEKVPAASAEADDEDERDDSVVVKSEIVEQEGEDELGDD